MILAGFPGCPADPGLPTRPSGPYKTEFLRWGQCPDKDCNAQGLGVWVIVWYFWGSVCQICHLTNRKLTSLRHLRHMTYKIKIKLTDFPGAPLFPFLPGWALSPFIKNPSLISYNPLHDDFVYFHFKFYVLITTSYRWPVNSFKSRKTRRTSRSRSTFIPWNANESHLPYSPLKIQSHAYTQPHYQI